MRASPAGVRDTRKGAVWATTPPFFVGVSGFRPESKAAWPVRCGNGGQGAPVRQAGHSAFADAARLDEAFGLLNGPRFRLAHRIVISQA